MDDYRELCIKLFGTDDIYELEKISKRIFSGRKKALNKYDVEQIIKMQKDGKTTKEIADYYGVSRQTISKYINKPLNEDYTLRIDFMFKQKVCTEIYVDFIDEKINICNRTDDIIKRAFGINENPTWQDFNDFLEERCFPKSRAMCKSILRELKIDSYDPLQILELTNGRTADDNQYLKFTWKKRMTA